MLQFCQYEVHQLILFLLSFFFFFPSVNLPSYEEALTQRETATTFETPDRFPAIPIRLRPDRMELYCYCRVRLVLGTTAERYGIQVCLAVWMVEA